MSDSDNVTMPRRHVPTRLFLFKCFVCFTCASVGLQFCKQSDMLALNATALFAYRLGLGVRVSYGVSVSYRNV